ncbi:MAG: HEAT repeat domain-containing protein [Planctomycetes bacterium]|jgi:hypothetical protein|nr:HEAT repeat domain-containing protein [Planctomycetota bacterium]HNZ66880.1 HEAT repeat domain-containing protein [Planctomycetota bacterium]HPY75895.1 HEAT repeat domain-containing protein [Planctomycetota bacterium]HQB01045.1 HEAT repeat domain-containing protein [Planctomycetota bacterium]
MKHIFFFIILCIIIGCNNSSTLNINSDREKQSIEVSFPEQVNASALTPKQRTQLRKNLNVFYKGSKTEDWKRARQEILALGPIGIESLCIFFVKFFYSGKGQITMAQDFDQGERVMQDAVHELASLKKAAVPYVIWAMSRSDIGSLGRLLCSQTLTKIGKDSVPLLIDNIGKGTNAFQRSVLETLGTIRDYDALEPMANFYFEQSKNINENDELQFALRYASIKAIANFRSEITLSIFESALNDTNDLIFKLVVEEMLSYTDDEIVPLLQKALPKAKTRLPGHYSKIQKRLQYFRT